MKSFALVAVLAVGLVAAGCGSPESDPGPAPKFGSDAGPRVGGAAAGGNAPAPKAPASNNTDLGG